MRYFPRPPRTDGFNVRPARFWKNHLQTNRRVPPRKVQRHMPFVNIR
nr:MAG TPA: hypothetical protein [Caudoviricetes sp.]